MFYFDITSLVNLFESLNPENRINNNFLFYAFTFTLKCCLLNEGHNDVIFKILLLKFTARIKWLPYVCSCMFLPRMSILSLTWQQICDESKKLQNTVEIGKILDQELGMASILLIMTRPLQFRYCITIAH